VFLEVLVDTVALVGFVNDVVVSWACVPPSGSNESTVSVSLDVLVFLSPVVLFVKEVEFVKPVALDVLVFLLVLFVNPVLLEVLFVNPVEFVNPVLLLVPEVVLFVKLVAFVNEVLLLVPEVVLFVNPVEFVKEVLLEVDCDVLSSYAVLVSNVVSFVNAVLNEVLSSYAVLVSNVVVLLVDCEVLS